MFSESNCMPSQSGNDAVKFSGNESYHKLSLNKI